MRTLPVTLLAALLLSACTRSNDANAPTTKTSVAQTSADIAKSYKQLKSMTPAPVNVDPVVSMLCIGRPQKPVQDTSKTKGPHAHTAITIYMNDSAASTFTAATKPYPVGAIIVKEKKASNSNLHPIQAHDGVGGMIKRAPGYDPDHGDWEYFYFEDPTKIESGKIESCFQCHAGAAANDHVFGGWANNH